MAILHRATLTPSKPEIVASWLDRQPWGGSGEVETIGSYRFDDPEGQVGVEAILVRRDGAVLQVAMTYREAPLDDATAHLIGTLEHSVLGTRWVYDAAGDPVAQGCFTRALAGDQEQASLEVYDGDELIAVRDPDVRVRRETGEGAPGELRIGQVLGAAPEGAERLVAAWSDGEAVIAVR